MQEKIYGWQILLINLTVPHTAYLQFRDPVRLSQSEVMG
jgi:hypothetical protein